MIDRLKIKGLMGSNNMKQIDVAKALGISVNAFNMKLNNKSKFNENEVKDMAVFFNVEVDFLFKQ